MICSGISDSCLTYPETFDNAQKFKRLFAKVCVEGVREVTSTLPGPRVSWCFCGLTEGLRRLSIVTMNGFHTEKIKATYLFLVNCFNH